MGVTIHYEGQLKSISAYKIVIDRAEIFAKSNNMEYEKFDSTVKQLSRVKDEKDWDYEGPAKGIKIQPAENTDPLWIEFDENYYVQDFCKTQFADVEIHIKIIALFKELEDHFESLTIVDEGEYWETQDAEHLQNLFDNCFSAMEEAIKENNRLTGPLRIESGRIIDLMEEDPE